jgi:hypothetical protein
MAANFRVPRVAAVLAAVALTPVFPAWGQPPESVTPAPATLGAPMPVTEPSPFAPAPQPSPFAPPVPSVPALPPAPAAPDPFAPTLRVDGVFGLGIQVVKPSIVNHVMGTATFPDGATTTVAVPQASLGWTAVPAFEASFFLPDALGYLALRYRFLVASGSGSADFSDGTPGDLQSQLDYNVVDFDYGSPTVTLFGSWDWSGRAGIRLGQIYFNSTLTNEIRQDRTSDWFLGAGPHGTLDVQRRLGFLPGLALFGSIDAGFLVGQVRQHYYETLFAPGVGSAQANGSVRATQTVPMLDLRAGLRYTPSVNPRLHFALGYDFEEWFNIGNVNGSHSNGRLTTNGAFLTAQLDY